MLTFGKLQGICRVSRCSNERSQTRTPPRHSRHADPQDRRPRTKSRLRHRATPPSNLQRIFHCTPRLALPCASSFRVSRLASSGVARPRHGREAKFYTLTKKGRKQLEAEALGWEQLSTAVALIMNSVE